MSARLSMGIQLTWLALAGLAWGAGAPAQEPFDLRTHLNWQIAICYHPMCLLIDEDRGTIQHRVRDGVLANTLAWGGRPVSNRNHWGWTNARQYDLRLYGRQQLEYFLIPAGAFDGARVPQAVAALTAPVFITAGAGERSFYTVQDDSLAVTALFVKDGQVWTRGYQRPGGKKGRFRDWEFFNQPLQDLK